MRFSFGEKGQRPEGAHVYQTFSLCDSRTSIWMQLPDAQPVCVGTYTAKQMIVGCDIELDWDAVKRALACFPRESVETVTPTARRPSFSCPPLIWFICGRT